MRNVKNKYSKWDLVWVYWIFENIIKKETENLEINLNNYKKETKDFKEKIQILINTTKCFFKNKAIKEPENENFIDPTIQKEIMKIIYSYLQQINFLNNLHLLICLNEYLEQVILNYLNKIFKESKKKTRPCLIFHKSNNYFWVMPISTTNLTNFNEKFDVKLDNKAHIECCSLQKIHISLIHNKMKINQKTNLSDINLQNQITKKFTWFFLKK